MTPAGPALCSSRAGGWGGGGYPPEHCSQGARPGAGTRQGTALLSKSVLGAGVVSGCGEETPDSPRERERKTQRGLGRGGVTHFPKVPPPEVGLGVVALGSISASGGSDQAAAEREAPGSIPGIASSTGPLSPLAASRALWGAGSSLHAVIQPHGAQLGPCHLGTLFCGSPCFPEKIQTQSRGDTPSRVPPDGAGQHGLTP